MNGLERELAALSAAVEWPDAPDLAPTVAGRLAEPLPRASRLARRPLAIAVAVVLAAVLAVLAVPPARTAILDWLGVGGARIVRVDELPRAPARHGTSTCSAGGRRSRRRGRRPGFPFADPPRDEPRAGRGAPRARAPRELRLARRGRRVA